MAGRGPLLGLLLIMLVLPAAMAAPPPDWPQQMAGVTSATGRDGSGLVVAVLDSGIDHTHPDLKGKFWTNPADSPNGRDDDLDGRADDVDGWDFCHDAPPRQVPGFFHGTFVAGVLAGEGVDGGVRGAAPGVRLMDLQVYCDDDDFPAIDPVQGRDSLRDGLAYAIAHGADIILMSLQTWHDQGEGLVPTVVHTAMPSPEEFQAAYDAGIIVVGAAGNSGDASSDQPGASPHVVTVGATTGCGFRHGYSNHGPDIDLWAPGRAYGPVLGGGHRWEGGTSFAAPLVAGAAALLLQGEPGLGPDTVLQRLLATAHGSEDGPVLDGYALLGVAPASGHTTLTLDDPLAVGGPYALQYVSHGDEPILMDVGADGYGRYCFNLADPEGLDYIIAPASGERLDVTARAIGLAWSSPWLNRTFTFRPDGPVQEKRPVVVHADEAPAEGSLATPAPSAVVIGLSLVAAALARRR